MEVWGIVSIPPTGRGGSRQHALQQRSGLISPVPLDLAYPTRLRKNTRDRYGGQNKGEMPKPRDRDYLSRTKEIRPPGRDMKKGPTRQNQSNRSVEPINRTRAHRPSHQRRHRASDVIVPATSMAQKPVEPIHQTRSMTWVSKCQKR